mmetsp:Transcript_35346/g.79740  ORF Transcript_35346/g.79740 Transcript_35346/m.79740 type:complete len:236 (-) Transcript_35346:145-852(-)
MSRVLMARATCAAVMLSCRRSLTNFASDRRKAASFRREPHRALGSSCVHTSLKKSATSSAGESIFKSSSIEAPPSPRPLRYRPRRASSSTAESWSTIGGWSIQGPRRAALTSPSSCVEYPSSCKCQRRETSSPSSCSRAPAVCPAACLMACLMACLVARGHRRSSKRPTLSEWYRSTIWAKSGSANSACRRRAQSWRRFGPSTWRRSARPGLGGASFAKASTLSTCLDGNPATFE